MSMAKRLRVARVFDDKAIQSRRDAVDQADGEEEEDKLKKPSWNGTLSANRFELMRIERLLHDNPARAKQCKQRLRWTLTISIELEAHGPWFRYIEASDMRPFERTQRKDKPRDKGDPFKGLAAAKGETFIAWEGWPWQEVNHPLKDVKMVLPWSRIR